MCSHFVTGDHGSSSELSQAADFVERAIYAFEHAFPVAFDITAGSSRLDFDRIENRPLFLTLHRHVLSVRISTSIEMGS